MKYYIFLFNCIVLSVYADTVQHSLDIVATQHQKLPILLVLETKNHSLEQVGDLLKKALEFKGQCTVALQQSGDYFTKQKMVELNQQGYAYVIFLQEDSRNIEWRAFDISFIKNISSKGKKVAKKGHVVRAWAYAVADSIWNMLTNEPPFFSTKIAFGKEVPLKNGLHYKHIYIADYDGSNPELLVNTPTINVSPRWNKDANRPLLFYSENTNANMRLMAVDMHKKKTIASNFDGLNMLPAFSSDGTSVVYCATRGSGSCQLYQWADKKLKKLTNNEGNNFCPTFCHDNKTIYFSSDFQSGNPQIYAYNIETHELTRITQDGYCVSPSFCANTNQLAYSKMINGVMQLFSYNHVTKEHTQLTFDNAQKEEGVWSSCGSFLLCPVEDAKSTRIALFNVITREYTYLTSPKEKCSCPAWSGVYNFYPVLA